MKMKLYPSSLWDFGSPSASFIPEVETSGKEMVRPSGTDKEWEVESQLESMSTISQGLERKANGFVKWTNAVSS